MKIHYLQHAPAEDIGNMRPLLLQHGHTLSATHLYDPSHGLPSVDEFDWLIIMGGAMSIYEEDTYPWLRAEKRLIKQAIQANKIILGICLGSQLVADALGAKIKRNPQLEIGWFEIRHSPEAKQTPLAEIMPTSIELFHWHGDTFEIPDGAIRIAESNACKNQGFIMGNRIVALQFHLEATPSLVNQMLQTGANELVDNSTYIQSAEKIRANSEGFVKSKTMMASLLDFLQAK